MSTVPLATVIVPLAGLVSSEKISTSLESFTKLLVVESVTARRAAYGVRPCGGDHCEGDAERREKRKAFTQAAPRAVMFERHGSISPFPCLIRHCLHYNDQGFLKHPYPITIILHCQVDLVKSFAFRPFRRRNVSFRSLFSPNAPRGAPSARVRAPGKRLHGGDQRLHVFGGVVAPGRSARRCARRPPPSSART